MLVKIPPAVAVVAAVSITLTSINAIFFISLNIFLRKSGAKVGIMFKSVMFAHTKLTKFNDYCTKTGANVQNLCLRFTVYGLQMITPCADLVQKEIAIIEWLASKSSVNCKL